MGLAGYVAKKHVFSIKKTNNFLVAAIDPNDNVGFIDNYFDNVTFFTKFERFDRFIEKLNNKYQTMIGENGVKLSGGEKQRLSIARAMLKKSKIVLLDEATSSLDSETENKIQEAINYLTKDRTTLVIAHRLSTILNSNKIFVVEQGEVIDQGKHEDLIKNSEIYKNFYERQIRKD